MLLDCIARESQRECACGRLRVWMPMRQPLGRPKALVTRARRSEHGRTDHHGAYEPVRTEAGITRVQNRLRPQGYLMPETLNYTRV